MLLRIPAIVNGSSDDHDRRFSQADHPRRFDIAGHASFSDLKVGAPVPSLIVTDLDRNRGPRTSKHPEEAKFVVQQVLGPLTLWTGSAKDLETANGFELDNMRGKEEIA